jgi:nucleotide sugar dehydrogenase
MANNMHSILHLKPEELDTPEKREAYTVSFVGCGKRAIFQALAFAEAGFKVKCTDADQSVVKRLSKGNIQLGDHQAEAKLKSLMRKEQLNATSDLAKAVSGSDVIVLSVNVKIDGKKISNASEAVTAFKQVGAVLPKGSLVVYGGVAGIGFVNSIVKETLENTSGFKAGEDFGLAYNPVLNAEGNKAGHITDRTLTIAAEDKYSLNAAVVIFGAITKKSVNKISNFKFAEAASLFEAAKHDTITALNNELAMFCENACLDYAETIKLVENNDPTASASPTIADEINRDEVYLLLENAENLSVKLRLPTIARQLNENMTKHALNLTQEALRATGKTLRRSKVALLGATEQGTGSATFAESLEAKGAKVSQYDPYGGGERRESKVAVKKTLNEAVEGADCVVLLSDQEHLKRLNLKKLHALMKSPAALVDLAGAVEQPKVESLGFAFRGLGKGEREQ